MGCVSEMRYIAYVLLNGSREGGMYAGGYFKSAVAYFGKWV